MTSQEPEEPVRRAEGNMDDAARDMERHGEQVDADIERSKRELDELRAKQGSTGPTGAAGDVTGDWEEPAEDERGESSGPGRWKAARE